MLQFLFDTDHLTLFDHGHVPVSSRHAAQPAGSVGVSAVTVQEYLKGRLAALSRYPQGTRHVQASAHLVASVLLFQRFPVVAYDQGADDRFQQFKAMRLRIGSQDLKIAAVALVNHLTLVTRNRRDFAAIPRLMLDDWSI
jgi:tRNA(fMet)-specific endonuclease VapC